jgi:hypothetical protein
MTMPAAIRARFQRTASVIAPPGISDNALAARPMVNINISPMDACDHLRSAR